MTQDSKLYLSRRKMLAGLGTVGLAAGGAGLGTSAYFNDTESFTDNTLTAGELNLLVDWYTDVDQGDATPEPDTASGTMDGEPVTYAYEITDVKPGDSGTVAFCPKIVDNPGYLWMGSRGGVVDYENGQTEPEAAVDATGDDPGEGDGELSQHVMVSVAQADSVDIVDGEVVCTNEAVLGGDSLYPTTLANLSSMLSAGMLIYPDYNDLSNPIYPASSGPADQQGKCLCVHWWVPETVGNEIQTDSISMDFEFVALQARHNSGAETANPFAD